MDGLLPVDTVLTQCGHAFHANCLREVLDDAKKQGNDQLCPICRAPTSMEQCTKVAELQQQIQGGSKEKKKENKADPTREERIKLVGSKITAIVELIEKIRDENPGDKVIIFIQWNRIRASLCDAFFQIFGFQPHVLEGSTAARTTTLNAFQNSKNPEDQVLLLSIEESATGINLPIANHCVFVHPMFGTHKRATDSEKQAIGRIRRQGQQKTCYLYRSRIITENIFTRKIQIWKFEKKIKT